ncbi:GNAT family N-acetyltransferase [Desulfarculus baarsii]
MGRSKDMARDLRWGGRVLGKPRKTRLAHKGAYNTEDTPYHVLEHVFTHVAPIAENDVIVDIGCGWGRVINYLLSLGAPNRVIGLELDPEVAADTAARLAPHANVSIVCADASAALPEDGTLFYLYNPFAEFVVRRLSARLMALPHLDRLRVVYYNSLHLEPFVKDPDWRIEPFQTPRGRVGALIRPARHLFSMNEGETEMKHSGEIVLRPADAQDGPAVMAIFNHYVANSFAAYPETPHPPQAFEHLLNICLDGSFVVAEEGGQVIGLGFLTPFLPAETLRRTAQVTYFIAPEHTGKGLGRLLLQSLVASARQRGVDTLLAHVSSLNQGSIRFHQQNGFERRGELQRVGRKHGQDFGVVYLQKFI